LHLCDAFCFLVFVSKQKRSSSSEMTTTTMQTSFFPFAVVSQREEKIG